MRLLYGMYYDDRGVYTASQGVIALPAAGDTPWHWAEDIVFNVVEGVVVDKTALQAVVDEALLLEEFDAFGDPSYCGPGWTALQSELAAAQAVLAVFGGPSQGEIDAAAAALRTAIDSLIPGGLCANIMDAQILGIGKVGEVLTGFAGWYYPNQWFPIPLVPHSLSYQWFRDGVAISGATGVNYTVQPVDGGTNLSVQITLDAGLHGVASTTSPGFAIEDIIRVQRAILPATGNVGATVSLDLAYTPVSAARSLQWLRDGVAIAGATGLSYRLVEADSGAVITVAISLTAAGFDPVSTVSTALQVSGPRAPRVEWVQVSPAGSVSAGTVLTVTYSVVHEPTAIVQIAWLRGNTVVQNGGTTYTPTVAGVVTARVTIYQMPFAPVMGVSNAVTVA
jgi:hypothetical protein